MGDGPRQAAVLMSESLVALPPARISQPPSGGRVSAPPLVAPFPRVALPRLALSIAEAAEAIGVSESHFKRHVLPRVRTTLIGRRRVVSVRELEGRRANEHKPGRGARGDRIDP